MNRADRRKAEKVQRHADAISRSASREQRIVIETKHKADVLQRIQQNGITIDDLSQNWHNGYDEGFSKGYDLAAENTLKSLYACVLLAARKKFGFGKKRALRLLTELDSTIITEFDNAELKQRVFNELGITFDFAAPMERVSMKEGR